VGGIGRRFGVAGEDEQPHGSGRFRLWL
jgi:hypothetical protein